MLCKIADLYVNVPTAGGMAPRCSAYQCFDAVKEDIVIRNDIYRADHYPGADEALVAYLESGIQFYGSLLRYDGLMLHASAVELDGKAYLFSGDCGVGKSTHTHLWQQVFDSKAEVFNDDKPALRRLNDRWYAYGTPWCGKNGINVNKKVPLSGICFLKQSSENCICRLSPQEVVPLFLKQTIHKGLGPKHMNLLLEHLDNLIREIPIFELENRPEPEAARLSYETMRRAAEEAGL